MKKSTSITYIARRFVDCDYCRKKAEYSLFASGFGTKNRHLCKEHHLMWMNDTLSI